MGRPPYPGAAWSGPDQPGYPRAIRNPYSEYHYSYPVPAQLFSYVAPWGPPPAPRRPWWRRPPIIGPVIAGIVIVVVVATTAALLVSSSSGNSGPSGAVRAYLGALEAGDSAKALRTMTTPGNSKLLTAAILRRQQATAKISDVRIVSTTDTGRDRAVVKATYSFGARNADVDYSVSRTDGRWRIERGTVEIDLTLGDMAPNKPTIYGVDISVDSKAYVFPGPIEWGTSNRYITASDSRIDDWPLGPSTFYYPQIDFDISSAGTAAVSSAVANHLADCAQSKQTDASVDRPGCSQQIVAADAVPGTVTWRNLQATDLSALQLRYSTYTDANAISVSGPVAWQATFRSSIDPAPQSRPAVEFLTGDVDLTRNPPVFTPD